MPACARRVRLSSAKAVVAFAVMLMCISASALASNTHSTAELPDQIAELIDARVRAALEELQGTASSRERRSADAPTPQADSSFLRKSKSRRSLKDITSLSSVDGVRNYGRSQDSTTRTYPNPDYLPTTAAEGFKYFELTPANGLPVQSFVGGYSARQTACLAVVSSRRCKNLDCSQLTKNNVAQIVYSWEPFLQRWLETGAGSSGPRSGVNMLTRFRPVVANGVKNLAHFSPDGVNDFVIPASFDEDLGSGNRQPTEQCTTVWKYAGLNQGWVKYQDCAWYGSGTRDIVPFKINGEQYIVQANMVKRTYTSSSPQVLLSEHYSQPSYVMKWSMRAIDNQNTPYASGFFLAGGERSNGTFTSTDPQYVAEVGNNGANVFQILDGLQGVTDAEVFTIVDVTYVAFSEHISNTECGPDGLGQAGDVGACQTVELESRIYVFDPTLANPRGDCPPQESGLSIVGCQRFHGQFKQFQSLPTKGARSMHFFEVHTTGATHRFLAVAEHRDDAMASPHSSIWRWNGQEFGLFQRLETNYAVHFRSFVANTETFLVVANRGCPEIERNSNATLDTCEGFQPIGRARVWIYDPFEDTFVLLPENGVLGSLHAYGADFLNADPSDPDSALFPRTAVPQGVEVFQQALFTPIGFTTNQSYIAVANQRITSVENVGSCPNTLKSQCHHPANMFQAGLSVQQGVTSQLNAVAQAASDNALYLTDLRSKIDGGENLLTGFNHDSAMDLLTFAADASVTFRIDGQQYLAVGSGEGYMSYEQCLSMYTDVRGPATECRHLSPSGLASTAMAAEEHCNQTCAGGSQSTPMMKNYKTSTIIYKIADAQKSLSSKPRLVEIQRISSLSVSHLHFFEHVEPATQASYEACANSSTAQSCYDEGKAQRRQFLVISNRRSSCELNHITGRIQAKDPARAANLYQWNAATMRFESHSRIEGCGVVSVHDFAVACQAQSAQSEKIPACGSYLAVAETCDREIALAAQEGQSSTGVGAKISFHKWNSRVGRFLHCQPYADPGDIRNQLESPCFQEPDRKRTTGTVASGDEHAFDFPDILPNTLVHGVDYSDNVAGYAAQLQDSNIKFIEFGLPKAQKDIFLVNSTLSENPPLTDSDQEPRTYYFVNGRRQYELVFSVTFTSKMAPQVFGLEALAPQDPVCAMSHPTTPRRRAFMLVQALADVSGGLQAVSFERPTLGGITNAYFVFPELQTRAGVDNLFGFGSRVSSVFVNEVCSEYTSHTFLDIQAQSLAFSGTLSPAKSSQYPTVDPKYCPYSLDPVHFEAWEGFRNHYNPVSPCKGRSASKDAPYTTILQRYYNSPPPASLLRYQHDLPAHNQYAFARASNAPVELSTHGYTQSDYQYLHDHRDDVLTKLQDVSTLGARSVSVFQVCGDGGQLFMIFGQVGYDTTLEDPPAAKKLIYTWNDRYAVESNGMDCTAAAARRAMLSADGDVLRARLGCFEFQVLSIPANPGSTAAINIFQAGDWLFVVHANHGLEVSDTIDPGACVNGVAASGDRTAVAGVFSYVASIDLSLNGGIQCRQDICCSQQDPSAILVSDVVYSQLVSKLKTTFVDLSSTQTVTGAKLFTSEDTEFITLTAHSVAVETSLFARGDVYAANIVTSGLVDGVDVSVLQQEAITLASASQTVLAQVEAYVCSAQSQGTSSGHRACFARALKTACYPRPTLTKDGLQQLSEVFSSYILARLNISSTSVEHVSITPLDNEFIVVIKDSVLDVEPAVASLNATLFTSDSLCFTSAADQVQSNNTARTAHSILIHNFPQGGDDFLTLELWRASIAYGLSSLGVSQASVVVQRYAPPSAMASTNVSASMAFVVYAKVGSLASIDAELASEDTWMEIYNYFVSKLPPHLTSGHRDFDSPALAIEYLPNEFVPPTGSGM